MKSDVFYWVLNLSIHGSLVCLLIWLLRLIRPIPRRALYLLWAGAGLRLLLPFASALPWSFMGLLRQLGARTVTLPAPSGSPGLVTANCVQAATDYFPIRYQSDALQSLFETCALLWAIVATACFLTMAVLYVLTRWELREAKPLRPGIWVSERVLSPGLVGIWKPKILVPPGMNGKLLDYVAAHERVHRRRLDNLWRLLALLICCVHWFNPLVWLSLQRFFADMELSCDETVVRTYPAENRKEYALALLSVAKGRDLFVSAFGGAKLRLRIDRVLSYRRLTLGASLACVLLAAAILTALAL